MQVETGKSVSVLYNNCVGDNPARVGKSNNQRILRRLLGMKYLQSSSVHNFQRSAICRLDMKCPKCMVCR